MTKTVMESKFDELIDITVNLFKIAESIAEEDLRHLHTDNVEKLREQTNRLTELLRTAKDYHDIAKMDMTFLVALVEDIDEQTMVKVLRAASQAARAKMVQAGLRTFGKSMVWESEA